MKKTKKNQKNAYTRNDIELPAVVDMESLSYVSDDDLDRRHSYLLGERERAVRLECDSRPWDTEICYVQRELKIRSDRRVAHERYLRTNPEASFYGSQSHSDELGTN